MGTPTVAGPGLADAFGHGYLVSTDSALFPAATAGWPRARYGPLTVALHPKTWPHRHAAGDIRHERCYPFEDIPRSDDLDAVFDEFHDVFLRGCRLLSSFGRTGISPTGGDDGGTTLRGAHRYLGGDAFAFTRLNPGSPSPSQYDDVFAANRLSVEAGLPHRIRRSGRAEPGSLFDRVFRTTWKAHRPSDVAARAMYEQLPHRFFQLRSMHAEVGTSFYRERCCCAVSTRANR